MGVFVLVLVLVLEGSHPKCVSKPGLVRPMTKPARMLSTTPKFSSTRTSTIAPEALLARKQCQIAMPMPERESYPDDHKRSETVTDEK
jgi:hypothetical protein